MLQRTSKFLQSRIVCIIGIWNAGLFPRVPPNASSLPIKYRFHFLYAGADMS